MSTTAMRLSPEKTSFVDIPLPPFSVSYVPQAVGPMRNEQRTSLYFRVRGSFPSPTATTGTESTVPGGQDLCPMHALCERGR